MSQDNATWSTDKCRLELVQGDITRQSTEAVVNAANKELAPGGGVAGAIHRAAGEKLWEECKKLGGCKTGEAKLTSGYNLPADYVIHTVGPVYSGAPRDEQLLSDSYLNSLRLAVENEISSVAFPALSTGAFGYPLEKAAPVALQTITDFLQEHGYPELVRLVLHTQQDLEEHVQILNDQFK
ncbi:MAG: macro domain-containing protein [Candidatus Acetothermia bacterium]